MLQTEPDDFRDELTRHVQRLQALKEEVREHGVLHRFQVPFAQIELEIDRLKANLSEVGQRPWAIMKTEFEATWNSFISDLKSLKLRLLEVQEEKKH